MNTLDASETKLTSFKNTLKSCRGRMKGTLHLGSNPLQGFVDNLRCSETVHRVKYGLSVLRYNYPINITSKDLIILIYIYIY